MILSRAFSSSRTSEFYTQFFRPRYDAWQKAIAQTPLVVMIWGPRQRTGIWTNQRRHIQETLRRMGHTVFFSEQLGVPIAALTKKGVEFLQSETADLIIVLQSTYDAVGAVQHFSEFRVVACKMLLFIDQAATDERLYHRALEDLRAAYNNVETYHYPTDIVHANLTIKIVEKIKLMQLVKYCVLKKSVGGLPSGGARPRRVGSGAATLAPVNLLEAYREQRATMDVLADSAALFVLAYANYIGKYNLKAFAHQIGLDEATLRTALMPLLRSQMLVHLDETLHVTNSGRRVLEQAGLIGWIPPVAVEARAQAAPPPRRTSWGRNVTVAFAAVLLFLVMMFYYWFSTSQTQLPLEYTPTRPAATQTLAPALLPTPSPLRR